MELLVLLGLALLAVPVLLVVALVKLSGLRQRVVELEIAVDALRRGPVATSARADSASADAMSRVVSPPLRDDGAPRPASVGPGVEAAPASASQPYAAVERGTAGPVHPAPAGELPPPRTPPPPAPAPPGMVERAAAAVRRWFTTGNVPVKVGMLVLLAGVGALLKYASDQGWLAVPVSLRLAGVAAAAVAGLVFGWRRRASHRSFALSVQGGMIGILLLVVFAAYRQFDLLPPSLAFAASVVLVAATGVLAVAQNARALAVFAILAGFLAPIWLSTGGGNHVALFAYYAVLNAAILAIARFRAWRELNLLGFAFTFGIATLWGVLSYAPAHYASAQSFLALFFAFYLLIPLLYARRRAPARRDIVDGALVFGTPLVAFSLQAGLLHDRTMALALCALGLGALYAMLARALLQRPGHAVLVQSYALLAVGFATLAVPLALSAQATACVFALEGAVLVWLGLRQQRRWPQVSGVGLQLAAAVAYMLAGPLPFGAVVMPFAHGRFAGGMLIAVAGLATAWSFRQAGSRSLAGIAYGWGVAWWLGIWAAELLRVAPAAMEPDLLLVLAIGSGWLAAELHRRRPERMLAATFFTALLAAVPLALWQSSVHAQPFAGHGAWAWAVFVICGLRGLACLRSGDASIARAAQFAWWLLWPLLLSLLGSWLAGRFGLGAGWWSLAVVAPWLLVTALALWRWTWLARPLGDAFAPARGALLCTFQVLLLLWWLPALRSAGDASPLPWLAVLNPLDLAQFAMLALLARWLWSEDAPDAWTRHRLPLLAAAGFLLLTAITLRGAHHWGGVAWDAGLPSSGLAQAALTVVWSVLGVLGWVLGSRRGHRALWLAGALLMAVVLAKLVLVDRGHLGNLWGIASFIAYGLLCTVVGFFAPAPPRAVHATEQPA
ncbi:DUF2339 domain-containing protein [Luteimonas sp. MHLX1A]|uniref:DUF2339 domain-containing protein n=1 Tax=Alterluteimonas muca TaxID=2878684 RepID=UPI001E407167|nr:DUF2339 domain-containing protein [Luteimonas sp. MHLX1A]MCD9047723.1 DUF2339 domain-containing protein [Luteimonas sp. MHLX1A]